MKKIWTILMTVTLLLCFLLTPAAALDEDCAHEWSDGICNLCGQACDHQWDENGWCPICDSFCYHESWNEGICQICGCECYHSWEYGVCWICGLSCPHEWDNGYCGTCDTYCWHDSWIDGICATCQSPCYHNMDSYLFQDGVCSMCGQPCDHYWYEGVCYICNSVCSHSWFDGICTVCDVVCDHGEIEEICSVCGLDPNAAPTACLRGDFNNWAYEYNMVLTDENVLSIQVPVTQKGNASFSLLYDGRTYGSSNTINAVFLHKLGNHYDLNVQFDHPGTYVFYLNIETMELRMQYVPDRMYVRATCNDWSQEIEMTDKGDGDYTATMILEPGEYTFAFSDHQYFTRTLNVTHSVPERSYVTADIRVYANDGLVGAMTVGNDPIVVVPTLTLDYPSLSFEDEILYNVYYTLDDATSVTEMGLVTFNESLADGTIDNAVEVIPGYVSSGSTYMAQSNGIPAKKLGDTLYFKVYAKLTDGTCVYSDIAGYNAVAYANTVLNNESSTDKAKSLVVAMLNYGAAAQEYFGYKTDALMNAALTAEQQALVSAYDETMVQEVVKADSSKVGSFVMNGGYSNIFPTVSFEGAFSINYYFHPNRTVDDGMTFYYWDSATYAGVDVLSAENATGTITMTQDGSNWGAAVEGIAAKAIDETVYVAGFYTSDGVACPTGVIAYSLGSYCKSVAANGTAFGAATAVYGYYAKAYFA